MCLKRFLTPVIKKFPYRKIIFLYEDSLVMQRTIFSDFRTNKHFSFYSALKNDLYYKEKRHLNNFSEGADTRLNEN